MSLKRTTAEERTQIGREYQGHHPVAKVLRDLKDALAEIERLEQVLLPALQRIRQHDGGRWIYHEDFLERQESMQEIAEAALHEVGALEP